MQPITMTATYSLPLMGIRNHMTRIATQLRLEHLTTPHGDQERPRR